MVNRSLAIGVGILVIVLLGFMFVSNMTGNVITGSVVQGNDVIIEDEYFRIDDFGSDDEVNEEEDLNDTQNSSGSR